MVRMQHPLHLRHADLVEVIENGTGTGINNQSVLAIDDRVHVADVGQLVQMLGESCPASPLGHRSLST